MICFAKPVLTEDLCIGNIFNNMLYVRYILYFTKAKHIHKRQTHLLVREDVNVRTTTAKVQLKRKYLVADLKGLDAKTN
jgi:hypothetical protein